jgi:DNA-binding NarL/FixJ family response regulator
VSTILVLDRSQVERQGLAVVLEMAGHYCLEANSLEAATQLLRQKHVDFVLSDSTIGDAGPPQIRQAIVGANQQVRILIMTDAGEPVEPAESTEGTRELTVTTSPLQWLSPGFAHISRPEALAIMLPEQESLNLLDELPQSPGLLNKLAVLYHSQSKFATAERLYLKALEAAEKGSKPDRGAAASIMNNLAGLYTDQKKFDKAEPLYLKSLSLVEEKYGRIHPKVMTRLMLLSHLYRIQGKGAEAEGIARRLIG